MKLITLPQPLASLVASGATGGIFTRTWRSTYQGPIFIHASQVRTKTPDRFLSHAEAPLGVVVGAATLVGCWISARENGQLGYLKSEISEAGYRTLRFIKATEEQRLVCNFSPGNFVWEMTDCRADVPPIFLRGRVGLWEWEDEFNEL